MKQIEITIFDQNNDIYHAPEDKEPIRTLDHIFITKHEHIAIDSFEVDTSDLAYTGSDHFPLITKVRIFG